MEHCVNKDRPELRCHGLCYLVDMQEQSDDKNDKKALVNTYKKVDMVFVSRIDLLPVLKTVKMINNNIHYIEKDYTEPEQEIIIPPPNNLNYYRIRSELNNQELKHIK